MTSHRRSLVTLMTMASTTCRLFLTSYEDQDQVQLQKIRPQSRPVKMKTISVKIRSPEPKMQWQKTSLPQSSPSQPPTFQKSLYFQMIPPLNLAGTSSPILKILEAPLPLRLFQLRVVTSSSLQPGSRAVSAEPTKQGFFNRLKNPHFQSIWLPLQP